MIGKQDSRQGTLFLYGDYKDIVPKDHIHRRVDKVLDLSWFRKEVEDCYCLDNGRPDIDPEAALRLMLAGFFQGIVQDRKLMREAQVNLAIRWFAGFQLHEKLPFHSSLTRMRQRWGAQRFKKVFLKISLVYSPPLASRRRPRRSEMSARTAASSTARHGKRFHSGLPDGCGYEPQAAGEGFIFTPTKPIRPVRSTSALISFIIGLIRRLQSYVKKSKNIKRDFQAKSCHPIRISYIRTVVRLAA